MRWMAAQTRILQKRVDILQDLVVMILKGDPLPRGVLVPNSGRQQIDPESRITPSVSDVSDLEGEKLVDVPQGVQEGCEQVRTEPDHPKPDEEPRRLEHNDVRNNKDQDLDMPKPDETTDDGTTLAWYDAPWLASLMAGTSRDNLQKLESSETAQAANRFQGKAYDQYTAEELAASLLEKVCPLGDSKVAALWLAYKNMREALPAIDYLVWEAVPRGLKLYSFGRRRRTRGKVKAKDFYKQ